MAFLRAFTVVLYGLISAVSYADLSYDRVQTYGMLPLDPHEAAAKGLSVNGLWAGFGMPEAVRSSTHVTSGPREYPVAWSYPAMKNYVDSCHEAGVLVPATLFGIAGHPLQRKRFPEMEGGACVGADGKRSYWSRDGDDSYFMCVHNPVHKKVLLTLGKEAIEAGADLIVIDEILGNEACFYWDNQPGFCEHCLAAYRNHLSATYSAQHLRERFDIDDLETFDFAQRLKDQRERTWADTDPLFKELWELHERLNFKERTDLVNRLRAHMKRVGREIPICGNVTNAGLFEFGGGHRFTGIKWANILDFLAFENGKAANGYRDCQLPAGKWVAFERLAESAFRLPSAILHLYGEMHPWEIDFLAGKSNRSIYLYAMLAEANANGCHFVNYFQPRGMPETEPLWDKCFAAQRFILLHRDLFEPEPDRGAKIAILYIENEGQRYRTWSYLGIAQALAESNIPFDVLVDGDNEYVPVTLTADALKGYQLVVVPQALHLAPAQKEAIETYVNGGGSLLTADPEEFGIVGGKTEEIRGQGRFVVLSRTEVPLRGACDLGTAYYFTYDDGAREQLANIVKKYTDTVLEAIGIDRAVCAYPYFQPREKRIIVHLVNSHYIPAENRMRLKKDITLRVRRPEFYQNVRHARVCSPDFPEETSINVMPVLKGDFIEVVVPRLDVYDVVVF